MTGEQGDGGLDPIAVVVARDEIRQLVYRYADAVDRRDVDLLVSLYAPDTRWPDGTGPEAARAFWEGSLGSIGVAVLLVGNHLIDVVDADTARGEVWCHAHVDDHHEGFIEQLIKYVDRYVRVDGRWRFASRRHLLWYGVPTAESPFDQSPAAWPQRQVGVGSIPYDDEAWRAFWARRADRVPEVADPAPVAGDRADRSPDTQERR